MPDIAPNGSLAITHDAKPLYRKVDTRTHGMLHGRGGKARRDRDTKAAARDERMAVGTRAGLRHGRDDTPLYRFLISKVGQPYAQVHAAAARLDDPERIHLLVVRSGDDRHRLVRVGESTCYSGLLVDENGLLAKVAPNLDHTMIDPSCACCTHTFNGNRFTRPYRPPTDENAR